jgi:leader peptidase (prepilin peptidase)/N-methyltransferase
MGGGDIKLVAVLGFWFGWVNLLLMMFLAFFVGGLVGSVLLLTGLKKRKDGIAFGPFLVLASFVVSMWGKPLLDWYFRISGL